MVTISHEHSIKNSSTYFVLKVASADVQCVIVTVEVGRHRAGLLAHRLHQLVAGTLDLVFVPHEVTHEPACKEKWM